ncbi:hypothetical protein DsansV1_C31g0216381 [Dioscorea sansibarensis]
MTIMVFGHAMIVIFSFLIMLFVYVYCRHGFPCCFIFPLQSAMLFFLVSLLCILLLFFFSCADLRDNMVPLHFIC